MTRSVALVAALCLAVPAARAQSVMGQVLDSATRRPLAGVAVRLRRAAAPDTTAVAQAVTQPDGVFALMAPDSGAYQVQIGAGFVGPVVRLTRDGDDQRIYMVPPPEAAAVPAGPAADRVYSEREVTRPAKWQSGSGERIDMRPLFADRAVPTGRLDYVALVEVVAGIDGRAVPGTARLVSTTNQDYGVLALRQVASGRFTPALLDGRPVPQRLRVPIRTQTRVVIRVERIGS